MKQCFTSVIQQHQGINGAYIEPPFDVEEIFGAKRIKVKATFDGMEYRGSIVRMGGIYMLGMTQEIRKRIGKDFGDIVEVTVEKDEEERVIELPSDFADLLEQNHEAKKTYDNLSFTAKKDYVQWIIGAKRAETRQDRISKAVNLLEAGKKLK